VAEQFVVPRRIKKAQVREQLPRLATLQQPLQRQCRPGIRPKIAPRKHTLDDVTRAIRSHPAEKIFTKDSVAEVDNRFTRAPSSKEGLRFVEQSTAFTNGSSVAFGIGQ